MKEPQDLQSADDIRRAYLTFFKSKSHQIIERSALVPKEDPTTLFTGSGMQPLIPYLLGQEHPSGVRLVDSQTCLRSQDIDEVGDNRHTTFFEMLGNWSLGDYFKEEQINFIFEFLVEVVKLPVQKLYVTCYYGDSSNNIPKDTLSADIWSKLYKSKGLTANRKDMIDVLQASQIGMDSNDRILFYQDKNWWCRNGDINSMPEGEPGGPDTEIFYEFDYVSHDPKFGKLCHVNCDCGRFVEIGNNVFMEYLKTKTGFRALPKQNVDFGGGLERIAQAKLNSSDVYDISLLKPIIEVIEKISQKSYDLNNSPMRIITDHLRAAVFLVLDGVKPSNKEQGYVLRRLIRRAILQAFSLGLTQNFTRQITDEVIKIYKDQFKEFEDDLSIAQIIENEEKVFRQTLRKGLNVLDKLTHETKRLTGSEMFLLYDTYGFPTELVIEESIMRGIEIVNDWQKDFSSLMADQKAKSQTAAKGVFKGGLADHSEITTKYHTATHLMYRALVTILGSHVVQRGSNITADRLRFDFSHPAKLTPEQITKIEKMVNDVIAQDLPVSFREEQTKQALASGVLGAFGDRYGDIVKVYTVGDPEGDHYSREICGGPHVQRTSELAHGNKHFKIIKEESSSSGVRRIKAVLV